jgi:hypothetical protein
MHYRRLACFLLGAWMGASLFMTMVATQNFRSVDRLLAAPAAPAAEQIGRMGPEAARKFLRYLVSEQNRWYFETWETIQLGLGLGVFLILVLKTPVSKGPPILALLMLVTVALAHWGLTPSIVQLGRAIDFEPASPASNERLQFWRLHTAYSVVEVSKWALGAILLAKLLARARRAKSAKVDMVDEADHRHIDR